MKFLKIFIPIVIAIFLILFDYKFSYLNNLRQSVATLISPIYMVVNLPSQLYTWIDEQGTNKDQLLSDNQNLKNELLKLKANLQTTQALTLENKKLKTLLESSYTIQQKDFILAGVTLISQSRLKKQLILDKGSSNNVKMGQVVLGSEGVVGQISQVTPFNSTVLMASDPTQHVPVKNSRNGVQGISRGVAENNHLLNVDFIETDLDIKIGDVFLSSGIGKKFPDGYPLGKVTRVEKRKNEPFLHIQLQPIQSTKHLEFVIIVND